MDDVISDWSSGHENKNGGAGKDKKGKAKAPKNEAPSHLDNKITNLDEPPEPEEEKK